MKYRYIDPAILRKLADRPVDGDRLATDFLQRFNHPFKHV